MTIEDTAGTVVRWWRGHKLLALGLAAAVVAVAFAVGYALLPHPERFRTTQDLIARLDELGAPCVDYVSQSDKDTYGLCHANGKGFVVGTDPADAARNLPEWPAVLAKSKDNDAVAAGEGWYVYGDRTYVTRVAELLGAELIT